MKAIQSLLCVLPLVVLTACGSGGGSGTAKTPDGTNIDLTNSENGLVGGKTAEGSLIGWNNDNSFYGVWVNDDKTYRELRYQGTQTSSSLLPKGTATYTGKSVYMNGVTGNVYTDGTSALNVDFDNKTVEGTITRTDARDITLSKGTISGSEFSGAASVDWSLISGTYKGAFYGTNAEEVAGMAEFSGNETHNTVFGGTR